VAPERLPGLTLARILRPWGRRGEVAAEVLTDFPERLLALKQADLCDTDARKPPSAVSILSCRIHLGQAIFHFSGVETISDAEKLRGLELQVPLAERAAIPPGRYYVDDLVGCEVWEQGADTPLGAVRGAQNTAAAGSAESWLLTVDTERGELLIPLAAEICTSIDTQARRIEVRLLDGLRDLNC
jgi:16S rRNA processing protein RimM